MQPSQIIVLATPVFLLAIAAEIALARSRPHPRHGLADTLSSISLGVLSQTSTVFLHGLRIGLYALVFDQVTLWRNDAFWMGPAGLLLALLLYDFCYYWLHRLGHEVAVLWAAHAVHHQSQHYNLSTALRQTSSGLLLGWLFYLPMALIGVPPVVFGIVALIDLLYQFWVHTEQVGRLGWFDRWFCSPSNHRVHHAVNDRYLDRNYGGILVVWDRLFGTFQAEDPAERCIYGTRDPVDSWDPLGANAQVYASLARDSWQTCRWRDKLQVWLRRPGWRPADVAQRFPKEPFDIAAVTHYRPPLAASTQWFALAHFMLLLMGTAAFLWQADQAPLGHNALWFAVLLTGQWALGATLQGRISAWQALMLQCAALATATSALGWQAWHQIFKPLSLLFAILFIAFRAYQIRLRGQKDLEQPALWLLLALLASLAGDIFLMVPGYFLPGLASFLLAHGAYLQVFRWGQPWFAHRGALMGTLAVGCGMLAFLWWGGLPAGLRLPVAAYVLVIALMAAQALGRASRLRDRNAWLVALGAVCFLISDALLATNRFVHALPAAQVAVLSSYYLAQALMVHGMAQALTRPHSPPANPP